MKLLDRKEKESWLMMRKKKKNIYLKGQSSNEGNVKKSLMRMRESQNQLKLGKRRLMMLKSHSKLKRPSSLLGRWSEFWMKPLTIRMFTGWCQLLRLNWKTLRSLSLILRSLRRHFYSIVLISLRKLLIQITMPISCLSPFISSNESPHIRLGVRRRLLLWNSLVRLKYKAFSMLGSKHHEGQANRSLNWLLLICRALIHMIGFICSIFYLKMNRNPNLFWHIWKKCWSPTFNKSGK